MKMENKKVEEKAIEVQPFEVEFVKKLKSKPLIPSSPQPGEIPEDLLKLIIDGRILAVLRIPPDFKRCIEPVTVAFPHCTDVLLALPKLKNADDEIVDHFNDYFKFGRHRIILDQTQLDPILDNDLMECTDRDIEPNNTNSHLSESTLSQTVPILCDKPPWPNDGKGEHGWPPSWCLPPSCVTLAGKRNIYTELGLSSPFFIRRLFVGDLVWLYFFERMGIFKILGAILDDFATKGSIPISNGTVFPNDINDDVIALVLEAMVRETKSGLSSTVRDRTSTYRRCLGWTSDVGRKMGLDSVVNRAFSIHFHKFITSALEFYKDKRLAQAVQAISTPAGKTSVSTLTTISDTIELLKKAFDPFDYGRNYYNTLSGIVWVIAGMAIIRELRTSIGIPPAYENPYEYIPAAYDILVTKGPITPSQTNRYISHRECAINARGILLDLQVVNHSDTAISGELEIWLNVIEKKVEGYRSAYRSLTGVDLGSPPTAGIGPIEQEV